MTEEIKQIFMPKECMLCDKEAHHGVIDFAEGGKFLSLCKKDLMSFCKNSLKEDKAIKKLAELLKNATPTRIYGVANITLTIKDAKLLKTLYE